MSRRSSPPRGVAQRLRLLTDRAGTLVHVEPMKLLLSASRSCLTAVQSSTWRVRRLLPAALTLLSAAACAAEPNAVSLSPANDPNAADTTRDASTPPVEANDAGAPRESESCERMDILFVIDDSPSMQEEQENLRASFPKFIEVLDAYRVDEDRPLDYRIAVTTPGLTLTQWIESGNGSVYPSHMLEGDDGAFRRGCGLTQPWIASSDSDVLTKFTCLADVGTSGSAIEMPLGAAELGLTARVQDGQNAGFLREDALLALVVLTDEDDCSVHGDTYTIPGSTMQAPAIACEPRARELAPVSDYSATFDTLKGDPGRWAIASIAGPGPGVCMSSFGNALEATRLRELSEAKAPNGVFASVCDGDLSVALRQALDTFERACSSFPPLI